jgi:hypothetical protein
MSAARSRLAIGAGLAALLVCSATVGAGAAGLIGSKDIADDSIRSVDIKNGTLAGRDVKDGSLTAGDVAGGLKTRTGPDRVVTWAGAFTANSSSGNAGPLVTSVDTIPANSLVRGLALDFTGNTSACSSFTVDVRVPSVDDSTIASAYGPNGANQYYDDVITTQDSGTPVEIFASCAGGSQVPSFDFTIRFAITQLATAPSGTFQ